MGFVAVKRAIALRRLASIGLIAALVAIPQCATLTSLEDCTADRDCAAGTSCHPEGLFCEIGAPIRIGVLASLTGENRGRSIGIVGQQAAALVEARLNGGARVLGRGVQFVFEDDQSTVDGAVAAMERLLAKNVVAVVGPFSSAQAEATQAITAPIHLLHVTPFAGAFTLACLPAQRTVRNLFTLSTTIRRGSTAALVRYVRTKPKPLCDSLAILHIDDTTGLDYAASLKALFEQSGGKVVFETSFPRLRKESYAVEIQGLLAAMPAADCAVIVGTADIGSQLLADYELARRTNPAPSVQWLGVTLINDNALLTQTALGGGFFRAKGLIGADVDGTPSQRDAYRELRSLQNDALRAAGNTVEGDADLQNRFAAWFDAFALVSLALELRGDTRDPGALLDAFTRAANNEEGDVTYSPIDVADAIRAIQVARTRGAPAAVNYAGASGPVEFDASGFSPQPTYVFRVDVQNEGTPNATASFSRIAEYTEIEMLETVGQATQSCE